MYTAALMLVGQITDRQRALLAEAERYRVLAAARARRRQRRARASAGTSLVPAQEPAGTLSACGSSRAAPAR